METSSMVVVRAAVPGDTPGVLRCLEDFHAEHQLVEEDGGTDEPYDSSEYESWIPCGSDTSNAAEAFTFVAAMNCGGPEGGIESSDETICGVLLLFADDTLHELPHVGAHWDIAELYVAPVARGRGVGGKLLDHAAWWCARDARYALLEASSASLNTRASRFYVAHGFAVAGREVRFRDRVTRPHGPHTVHVLDLTAADVVSAVEPEPEPQRQSEPQSQPATKNSRSPTPGLADPELVRTGLTGSAVLWQSILVGSFALALYCHDRKSLNGAWILDDKGTITMNPVVRGETPWDQVWARDFWGHDQLASEESHKSWRPLCTASYRLNYQLAGHSGEPFWFHVVDRFLHALTSALALPVAALCLASRSQNEDARATSLSFCGPIVVAALFASHPIHVEAVANTTGRAEVLCALFYFAGFLAYAVHGAAVPLSSSRACAMNTTPTAIRGTAAVGAMLFFCWCSMLCKEHGITLPLMCTIWDAYVGTGTSIPEVWIYIVSMGARTGYESDGAMQEEKLLHEKSEIDNAQPWKAAAEQAASNEMESFAMTDGQAHVENRKAAPEAGKASLALGEEKTTASLDQTANAASSGSLMVCRRRALGLLLWRTILGAVGAVALVAWRLTKNGSGIPDFACEQNPAACESDRAVRFLHYSWLWCFNFWLLAWPDWLCPDWSGPSIPILRSFWTDYRSPSLLLLYFSIATFLVSAMTAALTPLHSRRKEGNQSNATYLNLRRTAVTSGFWLLITFVLSSNLFVFVGFVVADRTLYLPCFGFCLLLVQVIFIASPAPPGPNGYESREQEDKTYGRDGATSTDAAERPPAANVNQSRSWKVGGITLAAAVAILAAYVAKQQVQTDRWRDPILLWGEAYRINPGSCITGGEYGMSLTNGQMPRDAVPVLLDTHKRELTSGWFTASIMRKDAGSGRSRSDWIAQWSRMTNILQTRFKLVTAMGNAGQCGRALPLIEEALVLIDQQLAEIERQTSQFAQHPLSTNFDSMRDLHVGNTEFSSTAMHTDALNSGPTKDKYDKVRHGLTNSKAYLLISRSRCSSDLATMGHYAATAVSTQPSMAYAHEYANSVVGLIKNAQETTGLSPERIAVGWKPNSNPSSQVYERTFSFRSEPVAR